MDYKRHMVNDTFCVPTSFVGLIEFVKLNLIFCADASRGPGFARPIQLACQKSQIAKRLKKRRKKRRRREREGKKIEDSRANGIPRKPNGNDQWTE